MGTLGIKPRNLIGRFATAFLILTIAAAAIALSRPQRKSTYTERKASGIDIVVAIDVSFSMLTEDFTLQGRSTTRMIAARQTIQNFIKQRPNDRIGIIPFAGQPYQESPITLEHKWLLEKLNKVQPDQRLVQGTAIGSAIAASSKLLDKRKDTKSRIIILISDGANNSGRMAPTTAAAYAKDLGIKIYTVAIGTKEGRLPNHIQSNSGSEFDTKTLKEIASITNAQYYRAKTTEDLRSSFSTIDQLEKTDNKHRTIINIEELHHYFTLAATIFLIIHTTLTTLNHPPSPE